MNNILPNKIARSCKENMIHADFISWPFFVYDDNLSQTEIK